MFLSVDFGTTSATVGYTLKNVTGGDAQARTTTGVVDFGDGAYGVEVTLPSTAVLVKWDTGGGTPVFAHESLIGPDKSLQTVEGSISELAAWRVILASAAGKLSGADTTTVTIRDTGDTKNRVVATVDASGNRSAVTLDTS